jgi:predicted ATPase
VTDAKVLDEVDGRYVFHHPIVHDAIYRGLPAARCDALHYRIGVAIERHLNGRARTPRITWRG